MTELQDVFLATVQEQLGDTALERAELESVVSSASDSVRAKLTSSISDTLRRDAKRMLRERRAQSSGFERRNFRRWKEAFDLYETMIVVAAEVGESCDAGLRLQAVQDNDYKFEAIAHLYPRSILIAQEILCLIKGGFPDGALARWRSLHEAAVTAIFISQQDQTVALNYLGSFAFHSLRAARQYNEHAQRANLNPFTAEQIADLEAVAEAVERQTGRCFKKEYDWACPAVSAATFHAIEESVGMDHWRPRYRWASQHTHAGHRPADRMLGLVESDSPVMLVGPSNSGFTDPLQMSGISLAQITACFLLYKPNMDRLVYSEVMLKWSEELGPLAQWVEQETLSEHREAQRNGGQSRPR